MPTSFVRLIVAGLTLVLAVMTGLVTGFVAGGDGCGDGRTPTSTASVAPTAGASSSSSSSVGGPAGPAGDADSPTPDEPAGPNIKVNPDQGGDADGTQPRLNETFALAGGCSGFDPLTAVVGFLGALLAGGIVAGIALFVPRTDGPGSGGPGSAGSDGTGAVRPVSSGGYDPGPVPAGAAVGAPIGGVGSRGSATGSHAVLTDAGAVATDSGRLGRERKTLVETCIYVRDRATSKAIADRLAWALNEVGVVEDRPAGEAFDTARHEAGGTTPTTDPALSGTIAAVEIAGYTDRGQIVRAPVVTVFQGEAR